MLNAANEVAVEAFSSGPDRFLEMSDRCADLMDRVPHVASPDLEALEATDSETRRLAYERIPTHGILIKATQLILSLSILVVLHELGHFVPAGSSAPA